MSLQRIFYVTQDTLIVWEVRDRLPRLFEDYLNDESGLRRFEEYLVSSSDQSSAFLVDVIEEEFKLQQIPKMSWRDRRNLIERRCAKAFRRTPYRTSLFQGKADAAGSEFNVVHSAVVNSQLLEPWMDIALRHCTPVCGVYSVPHLAQAAAKRLFAEQPNCLFVAPHQGQKLRQVFLQDGQLRSARLSQSSTNSEFDYARAVHSEVRRSRRYFERARLLSPIEQLEVRVIANETDAAEIATMSRDDSSITYEFIDPTVASHKLGRRKELREYHFEASYLSMLIRSQPTTSYATSGETRYWYMQKMRKVAIASCVAIGAVSSALSATLLTETLTLRSQAQEIQAQVQQLSETFRRENDRFDPIKADSYEMKLAVDSGDYILEHRVPVPWVMNQLGVVLADFADVHPQALRWSVESPPQPERRQRPGEQALPVAVPTILAVNATLTATIEPFDGDMRRAFARIDELASALETHTYFDAATVVEYPINTNVGATVAGEISERHSAEEVRFQVRVSYRPEANRAGQYDEPI